MVGVEVTNDRAHDTYLEQPLSDVFGTPKSFVNRITKQANRPKPPVAASTIRVSPSAQRLKPSRLRACSPQIAAPVRDVQDSGYYGSQDVPHAHSQASIWEDKENVADNQNDTVSTSVKEVSQRQNSRRAAAAGISEDTQKETGEVSPLATRDQPRMTDEETDKAIPKALVEDKDKASPIGPPHTERFSETGIDDAQNEGRRSGQTKRSDHDRSPSDGSSPIRPVVRKSSLNFASLPAREPLTAKKSMGPRASRTSHLDNSRKSYFGRATGGKSLGNHALHNSEEEDTAAEEHRGGHPTPRRENMALSHTKTYTQRLQDQINMLGKSQANATRPSKSTQYNPIAQQNVLAPRTAPPSLTSPSPTAKEQTKTTPGAFPQDEDDEDDKDDWIEPPTAPEEVNEPQLALPKSHSADVMEGIFDKTTVGETDFSEHREANCHSATNPALKSQSSFRGHIGHGKAASVSTLPVFSSAVDNEVIGSPLTKATTLADPVPESRQALAYPETPSKSLSRGFRDSPLKQVKNKLSSILKSSKGLLVSSAAISAEGKSSILSPSTSRVAIHACPSGSNVQNLAANSKRSQTSAPEELSQQHSTESTYETSVEHEKMEKRREHEAKHIAEQMHKLDKAREQERDKARIFSKEQAQLVKMEEKVAEKQSDEKSSIKEFPKPTRTSPRKVKQPDDGAVRLMGYDIDMTDAPSTVPPASGARTPGPSQSSRAKENKRPLKPTKETQVRPKQAPTVIRVNTGSQHSQYHNPSSLAANAHEAAPSSVPTPQSQISNTKASKASLHAKPSTQSLKSSTSSNRPKPLDYAAKKREQEDKEAQRRRDAKSEIERKKAAAQEEQRKQEPQRKQEAERLKQKERDQTAQIEAMKSAQRQAAIEKAKQTRAPPPAVRSHPNGPPDTALNEDKPASSALGQKIEIQQGQSASRMTTGIYRAQDESSRPVNTVLSNGSKASAKRTLAPEPPEDEQGKRPPSRGGPTYQVKDSKRQRTSENVQQQSEASIKGPPVRPSAGFKKASIADLAACLAQTLTSKQDLSKKSIFQNGYTNVPQGLNRDLVKGPLTGQQANQVKAAHPLDMAQISKGAIPFAPNANVASTAYKTPARPAAYNAGKSTAKSAKSSPRFQNGESIELPEIETDEEDEEDEAHGLNVASWADSPDLRRALVQQETMDPSQIFGPPAALNMEEVFSKNKERWHKFRARTSSANWSGADRLTEEDIRKDIAARDRLRREGAWSYEMSREMI